MLTLLSDIDLGQPSQVFDRLYYDPSQSLEEQFDCLDQDLFQAQYGSECQLLIDVGWYDAVEPRGIFAVNVIQNCNWEEPVIDIRTRDINIVKSSVIFCVEIVKSRLESIT